MSGTPFIYGGVGIVAGFIAGIAIGGWTSESRISEALDASMGDAQAAADAAAASQQEAMTALGERLSALEAAMSEGGSAAADMGAEVSATVEEKLAVMQETMTERLNALSARADEQAQAVQGALSDLSSGLQESAQLAAAAVAAGTTSKGEAASAEGMTVIDGLGVGETASFDGGKLRVFVSRMDRQRGSARLSMGGTMVSLGAGGTAPVPGMSCKVAVLGMTGDGLTLGSDCGAMGGAAESDSGETSAPEASASAPEGGIGAGSVAMLADGKLRVFVSGMAQDGSAARIAVNGITTQVVPVGGSVDAEVNGESCSVTVTGVGAGKVGLDGSCG